MLSAHEARSAVAPRCEAPSKLGGAPLGLVGHGLRTRQVRGLLAPGGPPTTIALDVRHAARGILHHLTVLPGAPRFTAVNTLDEAVRSVIKSRER